MPLLPAGHVFCLGLVGPKLAVRFPHMFVGLCVRTYIVRNNYNMYIVGIIAEREK